MKSLIAANWKMNKDTKEAATFIKQFKVLIKNNNNEILICPPFTLLHEINKLIKNSNINLGAQNMHSEQDGAFTGEISPSMVKDAGCEYVILGHSERRQLFKETDNQVNEKIKAALINKLKPILCIGESLEQRSNNDTNKVIKNQLLNQKNKIY